MDNNTELELIAIERERRRRKSVSIPVPAQEEPDSMKKYAESGSGIAAGLVGGLPDLVSLPVRAAGAGAAGIAKIAEMAGAGPAATRKKEFGWGIATQPTFTEKAQGVINRATGGYTEPTTAEGRVVQAGTQAAGNILGGGALKTGLQMAGKGLAKGAPYLGKALDDIAASKFFKYAAPQNTGHVTGAAGAGAGAQLVNEYAGDNPVLKTAATAGAALVGGGAGYALGRGAEGLVKTAMRIKAPSTGAGQALVGAKGSPVDPDIPFAQLSGKVRSAAANELKSVRSKYKRAEELAPKATFNQSALGSYKKGLEALRDGSFDPEAKNIFDNAIRYVTDLEQRNGSVNIGDIARGTRRAFSKLTTDVNGAKKTAGKEGVDFVDQFLNDAISNNRVTNIGKEGIKAWQDATSAARGYYTKFSDVDEIANIVSRDAKSNRKLLPSQVGSYFKPAAENSNAGNVWDATLAALPAGERAAANDAIRKGIIHQAMTSSLKQTGQGVVVDEPRLLGELMKLRADKGAWQKFTPTQRAAIDRLRAQLSRGGANPKNIKNAISSAVFAMTGRSLFGLGSAMTDAVVGPAQASVDEIIKLLDKPIPLGKAGGAKGAMLAPAAIQQTGQQSQTNQ